MRRYTNTRVAQSVAYNGRWIVQGWFPRVQVWADLGEPCEDYAHALRCEREWSNHLGAWPSERVRHTPTYVDGVCSTCGVEESEHLDPLP